LGGAKGRVNPVQASKVREAREARVERGALRARVIYQAVASVGDAIDAVA
jgi:hypothetical protein